MVFNNSPYNYQIDIYVEQFEEQIVKRCSSLHVRSLIMDKLVLLAVYTM